MPGDHGDLGAGRGIGSESTDSSASVGMTGRETRRANDVRRYGDEGDGFLRSLRSVEMTDKGTDCHAGVRTGAQ